MIQQFYTNSVQSVAPKAPMSFTEWSTRTFPRSASTRAYSIPNTPELECNVLTSEPPKLDLDNCGSHEDMVDEEYDLDAEMDDALLELEFENELDELFEVETEIEDSYLALEEAEVEDEHDITDNLHVNYCDECTKIRYTIAHNSIHNINNDKHVKYCHECTITKFSQPFANQPHGFDFSQWHMDRCTFCTHHAQQLKREGRFDVVAGKFLDITSDDEHETDFEMEYENDEEVEEEDDEEEYHVPQKILVLNFKI